MLLLPFTLQIHIILLQVTYVATCQVVMPLGSIAEWRARIGSSWCALGRPFKTRSPFRGGAGRLQTPLTLNQAVIMMAILIIFTAMNLALRIVWTTGHYHAYLGKYQFTWEKFLKCYEKLAILSEMHYLFRTFCKLDFPFKNHWSNIVPISTLHHHL